MVQIYERPPTFSEEMARSIGGTLGGVARGALEGHLGKKQRESEDKILESEFGMKFPANPELRKLMVANALKGRSSAQMEHAKQQASEKEMKGLASALDWLDENIGYTGTKVIPGFKSFTAGGANREAVGKREEFDKTGFWAADKAFTHFNKGVVNKEKFKELKEELSPRSDLSERKNKARIAALRRITGLNSDISPSEFNSKVDKEIKAVKKIEKSASGKEKLTNEIIDMFLDQAGGNPTEAKRLAKEAGYKW